MAELLQLPTPVPVNFSTGITHPPTNKGNQYLNYLLRRNYDNCSEYNRKYFSRHYFSLTEENVVHLISKELLD